ncbi:MAG: 3'-5' exonuclease, partial [Terriglobia bacterium]
AVERMLDEPQNRRMLATFRLLVNPEDSLAWATLLHLAPGVGTAMTEYIYNRARDARVQFGRALMAAHAENFPDKPHSSRKAGELIQSVCAWLDEHPLPEEPPGAGWGHWIVEISGGLIVLAPSADLSTLLQALDGLMELDQGLARYLSQITPLGKDRAVAESPGVRIMTMNSAKGLTVRATLLVGLEEGIVPRPDSDLQEERRLLYVAMTRAREYLFGTWARRRRGPTARAGQARVALRRNLTNFLRNGPVLTKDGNEYLHRASD